MKTSESLLYLLMFGATLFLPWYFFGWKMLLIVVLLMWVNSVACLHYVTNYTIKEGKENKDAL